MVNRRVFWIVVIDEKGHLSQQRAVFDRDEMAILLNDLDMTGYYVKKCDLQCVMGSDYLVKVNVVLEFCDWNIHNIPDYLERILGNKEEN